MRSALQHRSRSARPAKAPEVLAPQAPTLPLRPGNSRPLRNGACRETPLCSGAPSRRGAGKAGIAPKSEAATGFRSRPAVRGLCFCVKCSRRVLQQTRYPEKAPWGAAHFCSGAPSRHGAGKAGIAPKSEAATGFRSRPAVRGLCFCVKCSRRVLQQARYSEKAPWGAAHFCSGAPSRRGAGKKKPPAKRGPETPGDNPLSPPGGLPQARPQPQRCGRRGRAAPPAAARKRPPAPPR